MVEIAFKVCSQQVEGDRELRRTDIKEGPEETGQAIPSCSCFFPLPKWQSNFSPPSGSFFSSLALTHTSLVAQRRAVTSVVPCVTNLLVSRPWNYSRRSAWLPLTSWSLGGKGEDDISLRRDSDLVPAARSTGKGTHSPCSGKAEWRNQGPLGLRKE